MARMSRTSFFLPDDLKARAQREAERNGLDFSEYVRLCIAINLAQTDLVRLIRAGVDPAELQTPEGARSVLTALAQSLQNDDEPPQ